MNVLNSMASNVLDTGSKVAYSSAVIATSGMLKLSCVFFNKVLNEESKQKIDAMFEDPVLKPFHSKYKMITMMCKYETLDPMTFVKENKSMVDSFFASLGIPTPQTEEELKQAVNQHIGQIIELIQQQKDKIKSMFGKIGGTKRRRKSKNKKSRK